MENLRSSGFLGPVLLAEYERLKSERLPSSEIKTETVEFLFRLKTIADREKGEYGEQNYPGEYINVNTGIIGGSLSEETYVSAGLSRIESFDRVYSLAEGEKIPLAKSVVFDFLHRPGVSEINETYYEFGEDSKYNFGYCGQIVTDSSDDIEEDMDESSPYASK